MALSFGRTRFKELAALRNHPVATPAAHSTDQPQPLCHQQTRHSLLVDGRPELVEQLPLGVTQERVLELFARLPAQLRLGRVRRQAHNLVPKRDDLVVRIAEAACLIGTPWSVRLGVPDMEEESAVRMAQERLSWRD